MYDTLILNGTVVDGTGNPGYRASVAIQGDRVRVVRGSHANEEAQQVVDATGLIVAPGFIDMHSHSSLTIQHDPCHLPKVSQGVTTEVIGVDGISYAPFRTREQLRGLVHLYSGLEGRPELSYDWTSMAEYLGKFDGQVSVNVAAMIGNSALRLSVLGWGRGQASAGDMASMRAMLREAMQDGAFGLSTGLDYPPGSFATTEELTGLAEETAQWGGFYHTHLRSSLGDRFLDPIREAIEICRVSGAPLHLTHLFHREYSPGGTQQIFDLIHDAQATGVEITFDIYPYEWGSTTSLIKLPQWVFADGPDAALALMAEPRTRAKIREDIASWTDYGLWCGGLDHVRAGNLLSPEFAPFEGLMFGEIARARGQDAVDLLCDMLISENLGVNHVGRNPWGMTLPVFVTHPNGMVGTDSIFLGSRPSPRTYGSYPRILGDFVREERAMSLPEAVRKMTSFAAQRLGILDRGILRDGMKADIAVFDPARVRPVGTYDQPRQLCEGIEYVFVNGSMVMDRGKHTGVFPGRALRRAC